MFNIPNGVSQLHHYPYRNHRAKDTIKMMQSETGVLVEGSVLRALLDQGFDLSPEKDNKSQYFPQAMFDALEKYTTPIKFKPDTEAWDHAYSMTLKAFTFPEFVKPNGTLEFVMEAVKGEKASGAPEFKKKQEVSSKDFDRAYRWLHGEVTPPPCTAYHRVQHGTEGPKQRLVWGYPQSVTMAESMFARPLIEGFKTYRTPMMMGRHRHVVSARLVSILNSHAHYGIDFSAFDSTVNKDLIHMAFSVLWKNIHPGSRDLWLPFWRKIRTYFINTPILMPDGQVYIKNRGIPSGSYFTQMVGSIINYFVIQYANIVLFEHGVSDTHILVLGDDSIFSRPQLVSMDEFAKVLAELGLKVNVLKSVVTIDNEDAHFLGHIWRKGLVDRDPRDIAIRMAFPENRSKIKDPRSRIVHRIYPYVCDAISAHKMILSYSNAKNPLLLYNKGEIQEDSGIGWKQYLSTFTDSGRNDSNFLPVAVTGILK